MILPATNIDPKTPGNTIFDEEIAILEKRRIALESERQKLLSGQIAVVGTDHTSHMDINLGVLSATGADQVTLERNLKHSLTENPLVPILDNSFKKTRELREEMTQRGELTRQSNGKLSLLKVIKANNKLNRKLATKNKWLSKVIASSWLIVAGVFILLLWCGGPILYLVTGGFFGGKPVQIPATKTPYLTPTILVSPSPTAAKTTSSFANSGKVARAENIVFVPLTSDRKLEAFISKEGETNKLEQVTFTPTPDVEGTENTTITADSRVGDTPSQTGGFNGPHGAFLAPARMKITALGLDAPVLRAITQNGGSNGDGAIVSWPRPGEVVHTGAYPGEIGNMLIMGNQEDLGSLRGIQQNDEITISDRKGNVFIYRVVAFSPDGQTEREIDPTSISDAWVFSPTDEAILTILVSYPQPLQPVDPNQNGQSTSKATAKDDYLTTKKLAYRAVLAMYAPATISPSGTPVAVPDEAWQTVGATSRTPVEVTPVPVLTPTPTPVLTPIPAKTQNPPTPTSQVPSGLPDTGMGGSRNSIPPCKSRFYLWPF